MGFPSKARYDIEIMNKNYIYVCNKIVLYGGTRRNLSLRRYWPLYSNMEYKSCQWTRNIPSKARYDATNALCVPNRAQQDDEGWGFCFYSPLSSYD